jgi:hypothetical protein
MNIDLGCDNDMQAPGRASHRGQTPGFQRIRIGELLMAPAASMVSVRTRQWAGMR